jgi:hypothetical protein
LNYEEERLGLFEWYKRKTHEYIEASRVENSPGLDSPLDALHKQDTKEFNRRLLALQEKYGIAVEYTPELNQAMKDYYDFFGKPAHVAFMGSTTDERVVNIRKCIETNAPDLDAEEAYGKFLDTVHK